MGWGFGFANPEAVGDSVYVGVDGEGGFAPDLCKDDLGGFFADSWEGGELFECGGDFLVYELLTSCDDVFRLHAPEAAGFDDLCEFGLA